MSFYHHILLGHMFIEFLSEDSAHLSSKFLVLGTILVAEQMRFFPA
jgi:hypothetical protein